MVIAGNVGSRDKKEYTVMGDTVNLASRLEEISEKGQILTGPETRRYTQSKFEYAEAKATSIKGKTEPVQVYAVLGEARESPGAGGNTAEECMISSELVGRDKELNRLELSLLEVINGRGGIINVVGEAGIGKSRLIADFRGKCSDRKVLVLEGKALSMGVNLSFHPVIHLFKNWFSIAEDDDPKEALHKIGYRIKDIVGAGTEEIIPFIATLMGLELPDSMAEKITGIEGDKLELHLEHLKGIQIIRERRRFEEVEYIFKHALAQEVIYNSILLKKKKLLHVMVARAIELLFEDRLAEFYGMLAYHYSLGEDLEKAEQYLQKAGEQALRSSASAEALHYFTDALKLYKKSFGDTTDPEKIAELEQRIGTAYRNKGFYGEAVRHFKIAAGELKYEFEPKSNFRFSLLFGKAILAILRFLRKKHPIGNRGLTDIEKRELSLGYPLMAANSMVAARESVAVGFTLLPYIMKNRGKNEYNNMIISLSPMSFAFQGLPPGIARKMQTIAPAYIYTDDKKLQFQYEFSNIAFSLATGDTPPSYNEELLAYNLQYGDFQAVNCYLLWHGLLQIEKGDFPLVEKIVSFSNGIVSDYENDEAGLHSAMLNGRYFIKTGEIDSAIDELGEAVRLGGLTGLAMLQGWSLGIKLQVEAMKKDWESADKTMKQLLEFRDKETMIYTFTRSAQSIGELSYYLSKIRASNNNTGELKPLIDPRSVKKAIKNAVKNGSKWVADRTEIYKIIGQIYFSMGKNQRAKAWWEKAVETGSDLGATLEVKKTKAEMEKII